MAFDEAFGEWEARAGDCRPPALVLPEQGLTVNAAEAQAITEMALQGAWNRLMYALICTREDLCVCVCVCVCRRACVRNMKETQILVLKNFRLYLHIYVAFGLYVHTHVSTYPFICIHI